MHNTWHWHLETTVIDNIDKCIKENKGATTSEAYTFLRRPDLLLWIHWLQQLWECARDAATRFNTLLSATAPGPTRRPDYTQWSLALSCHTCLHTFVFLASQAASTSYDTTGTVVTQTYFLRYHGNSHRDSGEMNETISTWYTTSYDTTGTVVKRTKHSDLGQQGVRWWRQYLRTTEKGLCQHLLERPHLASGRRKLTRNRKLDSLSRISWTEPNLNENELKSNGSYEGMQAELEWKQARIEPIPTNMLHTFRDFHLIPTLHHHVRLEWD